MEKKEKNKIRKLLIDFGMNSLFNQKSEENRKFIEAIVDTYLKPKNNNNSPKNKENEN